MTLLFLLLLFAIWIYVGWMVGKYVKQKREERPKPKTPFKPLHGSSELREPSKRVFYRPRK